MSDADGGAIVVEPWFTTQIEPDEIHAQRFDDACTPLWGFNGSLVSDVNSATFPAATEDLFGGTVVAYFSFGNVYAQRLDAGGNKSWNGGSGVLVLALGATPTEAPVITPDGAGGAYVGYGRKINHVQNDGTVTTTAGYEFISAGALRFGMVYDGQRTRQRVPPYAWLPGGVFLAWYSSSTGNLHAQHVKNGPQWGDTVTMNGVAVAAVTPRFDVHDKRFYRLLRDDLASVDNGLIVAWYHHPNANTRVGVQRLDAGGGRLWGNDGVTVVDSSTAGGISTYWYYNLELPELATDGANGAILAWVDWRNSDNYPGDSDIYCQRVDAAGTVRWQTNGLWVTWPGDSTGETPPNSGTENQPAMVSDGNGGVIVVARDTGLTRNIYANRIDGDGVTVWTQWPVQDDYSAGAGDQDSPQVVFDGTGPAPVGAIVAWQGADNEAGERAVKIEVSDTPPGNDDVANAYPLYLIGASPHSALGSVYRATNDGAASCGSTPEQPDVWYRFTPPSAGVFDIDTCGSNDLYGVDVGLDTVLSLHLGAPGTISNELVCNDDAFRADCSDRGTRLRDSSLSRYLQAGQTVYVRVARYNETTNGQFALGWTFAADTDGDTVLDDFDNCTLAVNEDQRDTDGDGYGNRCDPDFNNDGGVNFADLAYLKSVFLSGDPDADLNGDGGVNFGDLAILKSMFLGTPGPSGLVP
ncbi:MAG: hypothetical protein P1P84_17910 [Deferrisomatales bacterium]|nr:hypothetical protein [Deferrisomatales bacterium]